MSLRNIIEDKYKLAIKAKNTNEVNTLRLIKSAIKDKDIAARIKNDGRKISDDEISSLLQNLVKQRRDSIDSFKLAAREDLILIEKSEIEIINKFLPEQISSKKIEEIIEKIIKDENFLSIKDMGKIMKILKDNYSGSLDMGLAGKISKSKLKN